jgi:hypothetical protein
MFASLYIFANLMGGEQLCGLTRQCPLSAALCTLHGHFRRCSEWLSFIYCENEMIRLDEGLGIVSERE